VFGDITSSLELAMGGEALRAPLCRIKVPQAFQVCFFKKGKKVEKNK